MVTLKMVAEQCGLSQAAVSKAMNGQPGISPEKAELVRKTAQEMGYLPNTVARTLRMGRSNNLGILFKNVLGNPFFSAILNGVRTEAESRGYDITFLSNSADDGKGDYIGYYEHARQRQCDGVIIAQGDYDAQSVARLVDGDIPVVSIEQSYPGHTTVLNDNVGSMEEVVRHLHALGHERIAFIHGEMGDTTRMRLAGFYRGCAECGIEVPEEYVVQARFQEPKDSGLATRELLALPERPTCILYPDDTSYLGGLTEAESQGLRVPDDVSCFGYDGTFFANILRPQLATYQQNADGIGRRAVAELVLAIENPKCFVPQTIYIPGKVVPGQTVKDLRS